MSSIFQRVRNIGRAKVERQVERRETPDVLARTAVRETEEGLARLQLSAADALKAEVNLRTKAEKERRIARTLRERAESQARTGDREGALEAIRVALVREHSAAEMDAQADAFVETNRQLVQQVETRRQQRQLVRANAQLQQARWASAQAAREAAEARYGRPGEIGASPFEMLELAEDRSNDEAAAGAALHMLNRGGVSGPELAYRPDFEAAARLEVDRLAAQPALDGPGMPELGDESAPSDGEISTAEAPVESGGEQAAG